MNYYKQVNNYYYSCMRKIICMTALNRCIIIIGLIIIIKLILLSLLSLSIVSYRMKEYP